MQAEFHRHLPDSNRLSVLMAIILLAYALTRFVSMPGRELAFQLPGIYLVFRLDYPSLVSILVAALAASGADWLLRDHPGFGSANTLQHLILPALTAWGMGLSLASLAEGLAWWIVFVMGGLLLALVLVAEFIVVDIMDTRHPPATAGLTALSFTLYLILAISLRSSDTRLYLLLPAVFLSVGLVSLRTMYLRLGGKWLYGWAVGIAIVVSQMAAGLHYLPLSPVRYGLILLGPTYALTSLAGALQDGKPFRSSLTEPLLMLGILWGLAAWFG